MTTLQMIWESSTGLLKRFDLFPTLDASFDKVIEESYEAVEALYNLKRRKNDLTRSDAMCEICDTIITLLNAGYASNVTFDCFPEDYPLSVLWEKANTPTIGEVIDKTILTPRSTMIAFQKQLFVVHQLIASIEDERSMSYGIYPGSYRLLATKIQHAIFLLLRVAHVHGLSAADFERSMESTLYKNDEKNSDTHEVRDGMIKRRIVQESES